MTQRESEQQLINIMFAVAYHVKHYHPEEWTTDETMQWVADQLRSMGYDTERQGISWGRLK